jgi:cell surface protein SprA
VTETFDQWQWNAKVGYALNFSDKNYISPMSWIGDFFLLRPWKDMKIYFSPRAFSMSTTFTRGQTQEQSRDQLLAKPTVRNFSATRSMNFNWQFVDGGILNLGTDYSLDISSTLLSFELDDFGRQRTFTQMLNDMLGKAKLIDFGTDLTYGQTINFNPRIVIPATYKLDRMFTMRLTYSARYDWQNNLQAGNLGKNAGNSGNLNGGFDINLKNIGNEIWSSNLMPQQPLPNDSTSPQRSFSIWDNIDRATRYLIKIPIFDFEKLGFTFTQSNRSQNSGVTGRPGFANIFGRVPFFQSSLAENGPSLMYQLGLSSDPQGDVIMKTKSRFPFFEGFSTPGLRAPGGNLTDQYSQSNSLTMRTSRPLWEGSNIEINWNLGWSYNVNRTIQSDSLGFTVENNRVVSGDVNRSYLSFPSFAMFKFLNTSIVEVQRLYAEARDNPDDIRTKDAKIAQAFENGLEALPFGKKIFGNLFPRPNWTFRWDGIEKLWLFSSFASRISFDHSYTSGYKMRWHIDPTGSQVTESQQATYGFSPLVGLNVTFKQLAKGNFTASFRYGLTTSYDLTPSNQNVVQADRTEISVSGEFARTGFEIPFFGLALSNDINVSVTYGYTKDARRVYDLAADPFVPAGTPLEGQSQTRIEPRIKYILSSRVSASVYYKYTKLKPDEGGSRIPGSTTNEGGLDIRVAIQP